MPSLTLANSLRAIYGSFGFSPASLFSGGAPGVWYDPSDYSTLFQDSVGTTPVTAVEQPVGLMLDKSQGLVLGPELVTNGTFDTNVTGWSSGYSATITWSVGSMLVTNGANDPGRATTPIATVVGKSYQLVGAINAGSNSAAFFAVSNAGNGGGEFAKTTLGPGAKTSIFTATATTTYVVAATGVLTSGANATFDNISVKSLPGNHAFQATSASRPVLSARYNLFLSSETFSNANWVKRSSTYSGTLLTSTNTAEASLSQTFGTTQPNGEYTCTVRASKGSSGTFMYVRSLFINSSAPSGVATFNLENGTVVYSGSAYSSATITDAGGGLYDCTVVGTKTVDTAVNRLDIGMTTSSTGGLSCSIGNSINIYRAQLIVTNNLPSNTYQRVNTSTDYATTGFLPYLKFDGVDDSMSTNSINFTSTDKMSVFAGVRKLSDAAAGVLYELSASFGASNGTFYSFAGNQSGAGAAAYAFGSRGTLSASLTSPTTYAAPITNVITGLGDISGDLATLRINGTQAAQSTADQGTGNYGNHPLYIGRRNNASLPFNGQLYSMTIVGKQVTATELSSTETYTAIKTGVTLA